MLERISPIGADAFVWSWDPRIRRGHAARDDRLNTLTAESARQSFYGTSMELLSALKGAGESAMNHAFSEVFGQDGDLYESDIWPHGSTAWQDALKATGFV